MKELETRRRAGAGREAACGAEREAPESSVRSQVRTPAREGAAAGFQVARPDRVNGAGGAGVLGGGGGLPPPRPRLTPARLAVFKTHVGSDFPFEVCVVIILLYFRPGSYNNTNNKLRFMEHLSFQRITKRFRDLNSSYKIK